MKILLIVFLLFIKISFSQNFNSDGRFPNHLFSTADFGSTTQIWTGSQASNGNLYFGNESTILEFNGNKWSFIISDSVGIPINIVNKINQSSVKKIVTSKSGTTFIARNNNFGYLKYEKDGKIYLHTLFQAFDKKNIGLPINVLDFENKNLIFFYENKIFQYNEISKKITEYKLTFLPKEYKLHYVYKIKKKALIVARNQNNQYENVVFDFETKKFEKKTQNFNDIIKNIAGVYIRNENNLIFNKTNQVFRLSSNYNNLKIDPEFTKKLENLEIENVNRVKVLNNRIFIATEHSGLYILDQDFQIIRQFSGSDGMESLKVHDFFFDDDKNLWICSDNGIQFFEMSSPITYFNKNEGITERIIKIDTYQGKEILATNSLGLFHSEIENNRKIFKQSNILNDGVYDVSTFKTSLGNKTLIIGNRGVFEINYITGKLNLIVEEYSYKIYQNPNNNDEFFVGNETSLGKINLSKSGWKYTELIPNLEGAIISLTSKGNNLIFGAQNQGVYIYDMLKNTFRVIKNDIVTNYFVENFQGSIYIGMNSGLYYLDENLEMLKPFTALNRKFIDDTKFSVFRLFNEKNNKLWYVSYRERIDSEILIETGWLEKNKGDWKSISWPFVWIDYFKGEIIYDINIKNQQEILLAASKGLFVYNNSIYKNINQKFEIEIDEFYTNKDLLFYNPKFAEKISAIPYENNTIKIVFHAKSFLGLKNMKYRYKLENYDDAWSNWTDENNVFFQKLPEGEYSILIEAKNIYGFTSLPFKYTFRISPPWYRSWWAYSLYVLFLIFIIYLITQLSIKRVKNQNLKLEAIVKERTSEIAEQNKVLAVQKLEIESKTKDIVDSIIYAKRIQETILPNERLKEMFKDFFVFYKPKDIVSGDFYWARKKGDSIIFSAIDCTGHGVPGALVSIVGNAALLRCVNEHKLIEPAEILDKLREIVVKSFDTKGDVNVKDGMDMSLCTLNVKTNVLKFAGANNECIIIRNKEIIELKPDKQPIGYFAHAKEFTQKEIQLQNGDCVYQFTDGFVDQFGGEKGKKLKSRPFKEFLISISHHNMLKQNQLIQEMFESWKEGYDQVDDVCVFGVKIS